MLVLQNSRQDQNAQASVRRYNIHRTTAVSHRTGSLLSRIADSLLSHRTGSLLPRTAQALLYRTVTLHMPRRLNPIACPPLLLCCARTLHTGQLCSGSFELDTAPDPQTTAGGPVSESCAEPLLLLKMTDPPRATSGGNGWFALRAAASETVRGLLGLTAELLDVSPADIEFSFSGLNPAASVNTLYAATRTLVRVYYAVRCHVRSC